MFDLILNFDRLIIFIMDHYKDQFLVGPGTLIYSVESHER